MQIMDLLYIDFEGCRSYPFPVSGPATVGVVSQARERTRSVHCVRADTLETWRYQVWSYCFGGEVISEFAETVTEYVITAF